MNTAFSHRLFPSGQKITAVMAAVMVLLLAVFSTSPQLHAWLHKHDAVSPVRHEAGSANSHPVPGFDDDNCVIVWFAHGVTAAAIALLAFVAIWQPTDLVVIKGADACRPSPRYWLPPLCGPPLR